MIFLEYKRGFLSPHQGMNQTRFYLISGVSYLAVLGILDFPIFGVATVGSKGRLLCAWGTRQQGSVSFLSITLFRWRSLTCSIAGKNKDPRRRHQLSRMGYQRSGSGDSICALPYQSAYDPSQCPGRQIRGSTQRFPRSMGGS